MKPFAGLRRTRYVRSLLVALAPVMLLSACFTTDFGGGGDAVQSRLHERFTVTANAHVEVSNVSGSIAVVPWSSPQIDIVARKHSDDADAVQNTTIDITSDGSPADNVDIRTRYPHEGFFFWGHNGASVDYTLHVPRGVSVRVASVSGDVSISGVSGDVAIDNVSGMVDARHLGGDLRIHTVSGSVDASLGRMRADADIEVEAVSGSVNLTLPPNGGAVVTAASISGSFDSDFPAVTVRHQTVGFDASGRIGDGSGSVDLHTISGSITISKG